MQIRQYNNYVKQLAVQEQQLEDLKNAEKDIQNLTDKYCKDIDVMTDDKEKEIMSI